MNIKIQQILNEFVTTLQEDYKENGVTLQNAIGETPSGAKWLVDILPTGDDIKVKIIIKDENLSCISTA